MTHPFRRSFAALALVTAVLAPSRSSAAALTACPPAVDPALALCGSLATPFTESGNTLGATSTISTVPLACNGRFETIAGAERLYPLLIGAGNAFTVTVTPAAGFDASVYLLSACGDGNTCARGTDAKVAGGTETLTVSGLAAGTYYLYVDSFHAASVTPTKGAGDYTLSISGSLGTVGAAKVAVTADENPSSVGELVTYTALVTYGGAVGVGTVTFGVDGVAQTPRPVGVDGKATFQHAFATPGPHAITATFSGGGACLGDGTATLGQTVEAVGTGGAGGSGQAGQGGTGGGAGSSGAGGSETAGGSAGTTSEGGSAGSSSGGSDAGGSSAGGSDAGGANAGGSDAGGANAGGSSAGGSSAGGTNAGGTNAGGTNAGGSGVGGSSVGGMSAGGMSVGGSNAGGSSAGGSSAGGMSAGGSGGSITKGGAGGTSMVGGSAGVSGASSTKGGSAGTSSMGGRAGAGAGGAAGRGGANVGGQAGTSGAAPIAASDDGGCGCRTAPAESKNGLFALVGLALIAIRRRRSR